MFEWNFGLKKLIKSGSLNTFGMFSAQPNQPTCFILRNKLSRKGSVFALLLSVDFRTNGRSMSLQFQQGLARKLKRIKVQKRQINFHKVCSYGIICYYEEGINMFYNAKQSIIGWSN